MQCPKCQYERTSADAAPDYECPKCHVVYAKYDAAAADRDAALRAKLAARAAPSQPAPVVAPTQTVNDKVTSCPACGGIVAYGIKACPHCGKTKPAPKPRSKLEKFGIFLLLAYVLYMFVSIGSNGSSRSSEPTSSSGPNPANDPAVQLGAQATIRAAGYRCDSVTAMTKLLIGTGFSVHCDNYRDNYTIEDRGGRISVKLD